MIHMNEVLRNSLLVFLDLFLPEMYSCTSIKDFEENKLNVPVTKKLVPFGVLFYNEYLVSMPSLIYSSEGRSSELGSVSDLASSLEVRLDTFRGPLDKEKRGLENGMKLYEPILTYRPKDDQLWLSTYKNEGPPEKKRSSEYVSTKGMSRSIAPI